MKVLLYLSVFIAVVLASDEDISHEIKQQEKHDHHEHHDEKHSKAHQVVSSANIHFAVDMYKHIASNAEKSHPQNIFFSPLSVTTAFSMLGLGAKSITHQKIVEGLKLNETHIKDEEIHEEFHSVLMALNKPKSNLQVDIGNAIFVHDQLKLQNSFEQGVKKFYHAELQASDFTHPMDAEKQINDYVKNKTEGKIEELVKDLSADTMLVLVNHIFFKGEWEHPFHPDSTHEGKFFVDANTTVEVQMMSRTGIYKIFRDNELPCTVFQLQYKDGAHLLLAVPELGKIHEIEEALSAKTIARWINSTHERMMKLNLPKFSISASLDLKEILSGMGMKDVFSNNADFSGIAENIGLKVSKATHKATLDVDEKGTVAAAATAIEMTLLALFHSENINKPFILLLCSEPTNTILFMGKVTDPTAK
ncbi:alpha-1-antiproteinase S-like [Discoglossus pictus]